MDVRRFIIIETSETGSLDYSQLLQDDITAVKISGSKAIISWENEEDTLDVPSSVSTLTTKSDVFRMSDLIDITSGQTGWEDGG
jgi:hypothetical protein